MTIDTTTVALISTTILLTIGCESRNEELARIASESAARQAQQSEQVAQASANLTAGAAELVEAAGRSQESLITLQHDLQAEQTQIGLQRDRLEEERRTLASQRAAVPLISGAILQAGLLIACLLPLILGWRVLSLMAAGAPEPDLTEVLLNDLTQDQPRLLNADIRLNAGVSPNRLPGSE